MSRQRQILNIMEEIFHGEKARMDPNEGLSYKIVKKKIIDGGVEENEFASIKNLLQLNLQKNDLELQMGVFEKDFRRQLRIMDKAISNEYKRIVETKITDARLKNKNFGGPVGPEGVETGGKNDNPFKGAYDSIKEGAKPPPKSWLVKGMEVKEGGRKSRRKHKRKRKRTRRKRRKRTKHKRRKGASTRRTRRRKQIGCRKN